MGAHGLKMFPVPLAPFECIGLAKMQIRRLAAGIDSKAQSYAKDQHCRRRSFFQELYHRNIWAVEGDSQFFLEAGGSGPAAEFYVDRIAELLERHSRELQRPVRVVDIGCGDFRLARALVERLPGLSYLGCDIVPKLVAHNSARFSSQRVRFRTLDAVSDRQPEGDVCLVRQLFQHLKNAEILAVLGAMRCPLVYVTEAHPLRRIGSPNPDKLSGESLRFDRHTGLGRRVELRHVPFFLPAEEVFRFCEAPNELLITERLQMPGFASRKHFSSTASVAVSA